MRSPNGKHNTPSLVISDQHIAGLQHASKTLLQENVLPFYAQPTKHHCLDGQLPLSQSLTKFHEVRYPLEFCLQEAETLLLYRSHITDEFQPNHRVFMNTGACNLQDV